MIGVLSPNANQFWDEVHKSSISGMVGQLDWIRACSCVDEEFISKSRDPDTQLEKLKEMQRA